MTGEIIKGSGMKRKLCIAAMALLSVAQMAGAAMVTKNTDSKLSMKKVLVVAGNSGSHGGARDNTLTILKSFAAMVPFQLTEGDPLNFTDAYLAPYDIIVFNYFFHTEISTTFSDKNKTAFINWLNKGGKGWVGYHNSGANQWNNGGAQAEWLWYQKNVTGMYYDLHGSGVPTGNCVITTDAKVLNMPIMDGLKANFPTFSASDEWYNYEATSPIFDTATHTNFMYFLTNAKAIGRFPESPHPVAWFREDEKKNRYFYSTFEHDPEQVKSDWNKSILLRALEYVSDYGTTAISTDNGRAANTGSGISFITNNRELRISLPGAYHLSVWSPEGRKLYSVNGNGAAAYNPAPFKQQGIYFVKLESKGKKITQKILIN
jgi:type 1 glutamine amidotransferase